MVSGPAAIAILHADQFIADIGIPALPIFPSLLHEHFGQEVKGQVFLATGSTEGAVHVWDTASCTPLLELLDGGPAITSLTFSPDGAQLAVALAGGELRIFEAP